jgi:hypothetical protein
MLAPKPAPSNSALAEVGVAMPVPSTRSLRFREMVGLGPPTVFGWPSSMGGFRCWAKGRYRSFAGSTLKLKFSPVTGDPDTATEVRLAPTMK